MEVQVSRASYPAACNACRMAPYGGLFLGPSLHALSEWRNTPGWDYSKQAHASELLRCNTLDPLQAWRPASGESPDGAVGPLHICSTPGQGCLDDPPLRNRQ